jgi:hypothetical protein
MKRLTIIIIILSVCKILPQAERLGSMGNIKYIVPDRYVTLNPFDFGGNPAWIYMDDVDSWLKFQPSYSGNTGDYKRNYDPQSQNVYGLTITGLKTLGDDGTFLGETSYEYDRKKDVARTLKRNPYAGEAFFFTDTTTGNFRYNGPKIKFSYSLEPVNNFFTGASASYKILDGLKDIYTRAEVLYREIEANIGAAYQLTDNFTIGMNFIYLDTQEKIQSKSEDLMDVEVYSFRGETYSLRKRSGTVDQKIRGKGSNLSGQIYYRPGITSEIALIGSYGNTGQRIIMPFSMTDLSFTEFEEGYTSFNTSSVLLRSRYELFRSFYAGLSAGYSNNYVWSKHTDYDKTLWEWEIEDVSGGIGFSYKITPSVLIAVEYDYIHLNADSSKYIDSKYISARSGNHNIRMGGEYEMIDNVYLRAGYNYTSLERDIVYGGENVTINRISAGAGIYLLPSLSLDILMEYNFYKGLPADLKKSGYSALTTVKLYSF